MQHTMRRSRQALTPDDCTTILTHASHGILALAADDCPYTVPLSFVHTDGVLYFHCAQSGLKLELMRRNANASFCVVAEDNIVPEAYTTLYRSVVCRGQLTEITDAAEKRAALVALGKKYAPHEPDTHLNAEIDSDWQAVTVLRFTISELSGKEAIELVNAREQ